MLRTFKPVSKKNNTSNDSNPSTTSNPSTPSIHSLIQLLNKLELTHEAKPVYLSYSLRIKSISSETEIALILSEIADQGILPNPVIINQLINKLSAIQNINAVLALHRFAVQNRIANTITYNSTIVAIAHSTTPNTNLACDLFHEAQQSGYTDAISYSCILDAIANSATPDRELALKILDETIRLFDFPDFNGDGNIDLHGLSFGQVYFGLHRQLSTMLSKPFYEPMKLCLIYGRGLHSHGINLTQGHPLKKAVVRVLNEISADRIKGAESKQNSGLFIITITPKLTLLSRQCTNQETTPFEPINLSHRAVNSPIPSSTTIERDISNESTKKTVTEQNQGAFEIPARPAQTIFFKQGMNPNAVPFEPENLKHETSAPFTQSMMYKQGIFAPKKGMNPNAASYEPHILKTRSSEHQCT